MSAEIENNKKEEKEPKKTFREGLQTYWQIGFKIIEIIICGICLGFAYEPARVTGLGSSRLHHVGIMYTAFTGYIMIISVMCVSRALGDRIPYKTSALFSVTGAAIFLIAGTLLTTDKMFLKGRNFYHPRMYLMDMMTTSIVFAFLNVIVFAIDALLTFRWQQDF